MILHFDQFGKAWISFVSIHMSRLSRELPAASTDQMDPGVSWDLSQPLTSPAYLLPLPFPRPSYTSMLSGAFRARRYKSEVHAFSPCTILTMETRLVGLADSLQK